jgi:hypothetical protein
MIHGDDILVTTNIGGSQVAVAACKSCSFDISQNFLQTCSPTSGRVKKKIPTDYDWSVSCDCLVANPQYAKQWIDAVKNGTELTLQFIMVGFKVVGKAFVKSCKSNDAKGSLANLSVQFEGSEGIDTDSQAWDFINGTLYTYGNFSDGTLYTGGAVTNGTLEPASES